MTGFLQRRGYSCRTRLDRLRATRSLPCRATGTLPATTIGEAGPARTTSCSDPNGPCIEETGVAD
jgi:hypothetical protein